MLDLVQSDLVRVEEELARESASAIEPVRDIAGYLMLSGGKRLRPALHLLAAKYCGYEAGVSAVRIGAILELVHNATLIHDDVIDSADTRRGRASTNSRWGNSMTVLAGDWLYMQAFQVALRLRNFRVLDVMSALTQTMVEGELLQLERIGKMDITEADYMELVDRKTASLFSACARLGALVSGGDESVETRLAEYAWNLGMAFQLVDDVLDFTSREAVLGKPVGNDLREGKVTLPVIYALTEAGANDRRLVKAVLRDGNYERVSFRQVLDLIQRYNGIERARERAQAFTKDARDIIGTFPESPPQRALSALTDLITERDH